MNATDLLKKYGNIKDATTDLIEEIGKLSEENVSQMPDETIEALIKATETINKLLVDSHALGKHIDKLCGN